MMYITCHQLVYGCVSDSLFGRISNEYHQEYLREILDNQVRRIESQASLWRLKGFVAYDK